MEPIRKFSPALIPLGVAVWLIGMALPSWYVAVAGLGAAGGGGGGGGAGGGGAARAPPGGGGRVSSPEA